MRLWSIHPEYLDAKGLVALWREALLAQRVLEGKTTGYKNHPQLERFKECKKPVSSIGYYLLQIWKEAQNRGYNFDKKKIAKSCTHIKRINVTDGQVLFELNHLKTKLRARNHNTYQTILKSKSIKPHPLFIVISGNKEEWER